MHSNITNTISGPDQGSPPAAVIWCIYFNPLLCHIEKKGILRDSESNIIAKIRPFGYMDDLTIITEIIKKYPVIHNEGKVLQNIPGHIQQSIVQLIQETINDVTNYFSINNIPQNEDKTHFITMQNDNHDNTNIKQKPHTETALTQWLQPSPVRNIKYGTMQLHQHSPDMTLFILRNSNFMVSGYI